MLILGILHSHHWSAHALWCFHLFFWNLSEAKFLVYVAVCLHFIPPSAKRRNLFAIFWLCLKKFQRFPHRCFWAQIESAHKSRWIERHLLRLANSASHSSFLLGQWEKTCVGRSCQSLYVSYSAQDLTLQICTVKDPASSQAGGRGYPSQGLFSNPHIPHRQVHTHTHTVSHVCHSRRAVIFSNCYWALISLACQVFHTLQKSIFKISLLFICPRNEMSV